MKAPLQTGTRWRYVGPQAVLGELHILVFVEDGEATTIGQSRAWHGPVEDFLAHFQPAQ